MKARPLLKWAGILCAFAAVSVFCIEAGGANETKGSAERPDVIRIETMAAYGKLELPPVAFPHDKHSDAVKKAGKDCTACHKEENGKLSLKFMRVKDGGAAALKSAYHDNCLACHKQTAAKGQKAGPQDGECRACHNPKAPAGTQLDMGFTNVLHYRHSGSKDIASPSGDKDNCGRCHHEYDKAAKKTLWAKGKEGTCRYCHLDAPKQDQTLGVEVKSFRQAAHNDCVLCHQSMEAKKIASGPVRCAGCHGTEAQKAIKDNNKKALEKVGELPRMKRNQPDAAVISVNVDKAAVAEGAKIYAMRPVPFDHKTHEQQNDTCRACHHKSLDSCTKCHTTQGTKDSNFVTLEQAMHRMETQRSCAGCHQTRQAEPKCAGCHKASDKVKKPEPQTCAKCHAEPVAGMPALDPAALSTMKIEEEKTLAEPYLSARKMEAQIYAQDDIPEKVMIKGLVDEYEPSELPHRKIVMTLLKNMKDDKLAGFFHSDQGTVCRGCHHNSPVSKTPPSCASCHAKPFSAKEPARPGLKAAYHDQCMGCHKAMKLEKPVATDCNNGCHKPRKK
ncbi:MAG TPA: cytochrome C [Desulfovibrio sp.]|jgi:hypothetical protein|nr:cytochrome C [Desulfovibrio sp.]